MIFGGIYVTGELEKFKNEARLIFGRTKYCQSEREEDKEPLKDEIEKLANNMMVLQNRGLSNLNKNLIESGRKVWDFIAEHNFAIELLKDNPDVPIEYEPNYLSKPPDFVVKKRGVNFWLQMKKLSKGERENRRDKIFQIIKEKLKDIEIPKVISIMLAEDFKEEDIESLISTIRRKSIKKNNKYYRFQYSNSKRKAQFYFTVPRRAKLKNLVLGSNGDIGMVNVTGLDANQYKNSLYKASIAFEWESDSTNINLIIMEADNKEDIDLGEACFGTEFNFYQNGNVCWRRKNDGFFYEEDCFSKVAGVIAVRRREYNPIPSSYSKTLFINEKYTDKIDIISHLIDLDETVHYYDYITA